MTHYIDMKQNDYTLLFQLNFYYYNTLLSTFKKNVSLSNVCIIVGIILLVLYIKYIYTLSMYFMFHFYLWCEKLNIKLLN